MAMRESIIRLIQCVCFYIFPPVFFDRSGDSAVVMITIPFTLMDFIFCHSDIDHPIWESVFINGVCHSLFLTKIMVSNLDDVLAVNAALGVKVNVTHPRQHGASLSEAFADGIIF